MIARLLGIIDNTTTVLVETIARELEIEYKNAPIVLYPTVQTIEIGDFTFDYEIKDRYINIEYLETYKNCSNMNEIIDFIDNCIGEDNAREYKTL